MKKYIKFLVVKIIYVIFLSFLFISNSFSISDKINSDQSKSNQTAKAKPKKERVSKNINIVELKGFKLGMTKKDFNKNWKLKKKRHRQSIASLLIPVYVTTLAGVYVDKPTIWWSKEKPKKIDTIQFRFFYNASSVYPIPCSDVDACPHVIQPASNFVRVVEAIKKKYPGFKCTETDLMNKMGAKWKNRRCIYHDGYGTSISTIRYRNNDERGTITILPTDIYMQGQKNNEKEFSKDL